jgi:hypothetical protein
MPFDPETAREAAYKSHEARRNGKLAEDDPESILEKMMTTANSERVRMDAARALVALRAKREEAEKPDVDPDAWLDKLTKEERATYEKILARAHMREAPPDESNTREYWEKRRAHAIEMQILYSQEQQFCFRMREGLLPTVTEAERRENFPEVTPRVTGTSRRDPRP